MSLPFLNIFRLRTALLVCFIGLTMFSGLTITFLTLRLSYTARINYTHEVGHLLTHSVTVKVDNFLQNVEDNVEFAERFLFKMKNEKVDYHLLFDNLAHSLIVNPNLSTFYYTEEKTGYTVKFAVREKRVRPRILGVSSSFGPVRVPLFGVSDTNQGRHS